MQRKAPFFGSAAFSCLVCSLLFLLCGVGVYLAFRQGTHLHSLLQALGFVLRPPSSKSLFSFVAANWLGDFFWSAALAMALLVILRSFQRRGALSLWIATACGAGFEFLQLAGKVGGTFDVWDIVAEACGAGFAVLLGLWIQKGGTTMKKTLSILLAILCCGVFVLFALGSGDNEEATVETGDAAAATLATESADKLTANVGDTLNAGDLKITYTACDADFTGYNEFLAPASGNKCIRLSFSVENTGDTEHFISTLDFDCYADDVAVQAYYGGEDDLSATLSPGRKASGSVYFEVPENAQSLEVEYTTDYWTGSKAIFVVA